MKRSEIPRDSGAEQDEWAGSFERVIVCAAGHGHVFGPDPSAWPEFAVRECEGWLRLALANRARGAKMIEHTLCCDRCGKIVEASTVSPAAARAAARTRGAAVRIGREDVCYSCEQRDPQRKDAFDVEA